MSSLKGSILDAINKNNGKTKKAYSPPEDNLEALLIRDRLDKMFFLRDHLDEKRAGLHASAIIVSDNEFCYREQVLSLLYHQTQGENHPAKLLRIFAAGSSIHEKWQRLFVKAGVASGIEARRYSEMYELYFTPDAEIILNGKKYVVEIKSMNTFTFSKANSHPSGNKQLMLYMYLLGIANGFVLAEDKNTQDFKVFPAKYDHEQVLPFIGRLNEIQQLKNIFLATRELPARKCKNCQTSKAQGCNMKDACFNVGTGRVKLLA